MSSPSTPTASTPAPGAALSNLTRIVRRRAKPGHEAAYEALVHEMFEKMRTIPGFQRGELIPPVAAGDPYQVISHWDSENAIQRWDNCRQHREVLERMKPVAEDEPDYRVLTGLEAFFPLPVVPATMHPPRVRMAFVTWLGIFPTAAFYLWFVAPLLGNWPFLLRTALVTLLIVYTMSYCVAPWLTKWMKPFLTPKPKTD